MSEETPSTETNYTSVPDPVPSRPANTKGTGPAVVATLLLAVAAGAYGLHEHGVAKSLGANNSSMAATLSATRDQLNALTAKVNQLETKPSPESLAKPAAALYRKPLTAAVGRHRIADTRWKKMQGQIDQQGRQIASTRDDLANTRAELQGSIARTHDDLVLLQKKGERNYYEFDVEKNGDFERQGAISIRLRKANTKHEYADLELMVDDFKVSKKHVNIDEPVVFYPGDEKMPVELVINSISKNHIHGYVSEPKYRGADLQAMANSTANAQGAPAASDQPGPGAKPSPARQKLQLPVDAPVR